MTEVNYEVLSEELGKKVEELEIELRSQKEQRLFLKGRIGELFGALQREAIGGDQRLKLRQEMEKRIGEL